MGSTVPEECYFAHIQDRVRNSAEHLFEVIANFLSIEVDVAAGVAESPQRARKTYG